MIRILYRFIWIIIFSSVLMACAVFQDSEQKSHAAICNELKHQIIWNGTNGSQELWNGATGNQMLATQQRAETETLTQNYREEGCQ